MFMRSSIHCMLLINIFGVHPSLVKMRVALCILPAILTSPGIYTNEDLYHNDETDSEFVVLWHFFGTLWFRTYHAHVRQYERSSSVQWHYTWWSVLGRNQCAQYGLDKGSTGKWEQRQAFAETETIHDMGHGHAAYADSQTTRSTLHWPDKEWSWMLGVGYLLLGRLCDKNHVRAARVEEFTCRRQRSVLWALRCGNG